MPQSSNEAQEQDVGRKEVEVLCLKAPLVYSYAKATQISIKSCVIASISEIIHESMLSIMIFYLSSCAY